MIKELLQNQTALAMGVMSHLMLYILINLMFGKKEYRWLFALTNIAHLCIANIGMNIFLYNKFGEKIEFLVCMTIIENILPVLIVVIQSVVWNVNFIKMLLAFMVADTFSGMIVYVVEKISEEPGKIILFSAIVYAMMYLLFAPFFRRYRNVEMQHPWIIGGFMMVTICNGMLSRFDVWIEKTMFSSKMFQIGVYQTIFTIGFLLAEFGIYQFVLKRKWQMLLRNKEQIESYYQHANKHISEMKRTYQLLENSKLLMIGGKNKGTEYLREYLKNLREQYARLNDIFYCNDFVVDSVLRDFVESCHKRNIHTEILFHEYERGEVAAEDIAAILSCMLDDILPIFPAYPDKGQTVNKENQMIRVQGGLVRNQLIFSVMAIRKDGNELIHKILIKKKNFYPWLKKYHGMVYIKKERDAVQIVISLNNKKEKKDEIIF